MPRLVSLLVKFSGTADHSLSGAIMFNDSLTLDQCERLVTQLAKTALPFQCAHGR